MVTLGLCSFALRPAMADPLEDADTMATSKATDRESAAVQRKKEIQTSGALERRVPCDQVVSTFDHLSTLSGKPVEAGNVAQKLNTSGFWVDRCMGAYGRRLRHVAAQNSEETEERLEHLEEDEPEETAPEDIEEEGASAHLERPERENMSRGKPTPKSDDAGSAEGYGR